jgi:hypothetical protein
VRAAEPPANQPVTAADRTLVKKQLGSAMSDVDPEKELDVTKTDLNGDGRADYMVVLKTFAYCGSGGCSAFVYLSEGAEAYRSVVPDLLAFKIAPGPSATRGVRDLVIEQRGGSARWTWNGKAYQRAAP